MVTIDIHWAKAVCICEEGDWEKKQKSTAFLTFYDSNMDLEDQFYRLKDQHLHLKKEAQDAKHQVKILNTRVARLISDKKSQLRGQKSGREVELEELIMDMNTRVSELERENLRLKEKSLLLRSQLVCSHAVRRDVSSAYAHIPARVDSGLRRRRSAPANHNLNRLKSFSTTTLCKVPAASCSRQNSPKLIAAKGVQVKLNPKDQIMRWNDPVYFQLFVEPKEVSKITGSKHNHPLRASGRERVYGNGFNQALTTRQSPDSGGEADHQINDVNRKSFQLTTRRGDQISSNVFPDHQFMSLNDGAKQSSELVDTEFGMNAKLSVFVESLKEKLKQEKEKNSRLEKLLLSNKISSKTLEEYKHRVSELQEENEILQESLRKCVGSCFTELKSPVNLNKETSLEVKRLEIVEALQKQVHRLTDKVRHLESEKASLHQQLINEQETVFRLDEENAKLATKLEEIAITGPSFEGSDARKQLESRPVGTVNMEEQLTQMQRERSEVLKEFSEMRQILETIQSNIHTSEADEYDDDFEETSSVADSHRN